MSPFRSFRDMSIKYKLIIAFLIALVPVFTAGTIISFWVMKTELESNMESELHRVTEALANSVESSARVAIQNYLRAVVEQSANTMGFLHDRMTAQKFSREEFMEAVQDLLGSQVIGDSGYIVCIDTNADVTYHPRNEIVGVNYSELPFIQKILSDGGGYVEYDLKKPEGEIDSPKALYATYFEPLGWYIAATAYREEFKSLIHLEDIDQLVHALDIGTNGFSFTTNEDGTYYYTSVSNEKESAADYFTAAQVTEMISRKTGNFVYTWDAPGMEKPQKMKAFFSHLPAYGWIVGAAYSENELRAPLEKLSTVVLSTALLTILAALLVSFRFGALANRSLSDIVGRFEKGAGGDFTTRLDVRSKDELGILAGHFNTFMEKLEIYDREMREAFENRQRLEKETQKLAMAVEQGSDIVVITNTKGVIEYVNPAFEVSSGYAKSEAIGNTPRVLRSGLHDKAFYTKLWRTISEGKTWSGHFINKKKNGELLHEQATITPMRDATGKIIHYVASKRDVTEKVQLENQLRQAQRIDAIGSLAGGIAHDFNNILTGIMGYTEMCMQDVPSDNSVYSRLDKILQASHRAKDLIHHIQIFSRQAPVELKPVLLHAIVKEAMKLLRASIPSTIEFVDRIDNVGILLADPTQIHQIVMNLCTNAYHAMTESGGAISVTLTRDQIESGSRYTLLGIPPGNYAKFLVADTGGGIPKDIQEKIFDPYYTTKPEGEGTGLGLSVVHGIVKGLHGHIEVSSVQNQGTTFTIYLPLTETESDPPRKEKRRVLKGNGETILVVDDDLTVLDMTIEMLKRLNYRPVARSSAIEALNLLKSSQDSFQAVVTDFTMPGMDGLKLAEEIKKISPDIPILLCSGFGDVQAVNTAVQKGLVKKINKPLVLQEMAEAITKCLAL